MSQILESISVEGSVSRLRGFIRTGGYLRGDRLPAERELTEQLGLTRSCLRKALDVLESDGALWRHVGKGTFVAHESNGTGVSSLVELGRRLTPFRMMRARIAIEPAIAREAAINASGQTMTQMKLALERARAASNWADYEVQDDIFHRTVAESSDNQLLLMLFDQLNHVRRAVAWGNVSRDSARPPANHKSFAEHEAIEQAIENRNPDLAYEAMRAHLRSVSALFGEV
ncbi:MAG: DNA-binding FadR family transcriptional regulator [Paracoccaceae bacterium]|jgi:DNA-binding FadR family transcriptional regulator